MTLQALTIAIASLALVLSIVQFLTRQRPYVCVTSLRLIRDEMGDAIEVEVTNLGDVPAREVNMKTTEGESGMSNERSIGAVFPNQRLRTFVGTQDVATPVGLHVKLTYGGPFSVGWRRLGYGFHHTSQPLYADDQGWGAWAGKQADFS